MDEGQQMYDMVRRLILIRSTIAGDGVREKLKVLQDTDPSLNVSVSGFPSGSRVYDWTVPKEWKCRYAYVTAPSGKRICDISENILYVWQHSVPVNMDVTLAELREHLVTYREQPAAIPYITTYYEKNWGFCIPYDEYSTLENGTYHVFIDSEFRPGEMNYGEIIIKGTSDDEVLITTYICHPGMADDNNSGTALALQLAGYVSGMSNKRYTYRFVFAPETIGAIAYISRNMAYLKEHVKAGFSLSCVGDERSYSIIHSRYGDTLADAVLTEALRSCHREFTDYPFLERGSDERQYQAPGVDIPMVGFCRTKYGSFPEYHTSLDDMSLVTPAGLQGSMDVMKQAVDILEANRIYKVTTLCEPMLGRRGLVPNVSDKEKYRLTADIKNLIAYADGSNDLLDISRIIHVSVARIAELIPVLLADGIIREVS